MSTQGSSCRLLFALFVSILITVSNTDADVVAIQFADPSGDGVFTVDDPTTSAGGLTATPATYGTLGWFIDTGPAGLLCFGNAAGDISGAPTFDGLFNVRGSGDWSNAVEFANGDLIDSGSGTTGWGVVGGLGGTTDRDGLAAGSHLLGFRTIAGNFGWMEVNYDDGGTSPITDDVIVINQAYIESTVERGINAGDTGAIPEPSSTALLGVCLIGAWMRRLR